jgi:hypothetical protein
MSPDVPGDSLTSDRQGGRPGAEVGVRDSARRYLWPIRISFSKHQRPRTLRPASSPSACVRFWAGRRAAANADYGKAGPRHAQSKPASSRNTPRHTTRPYRSPLRACRNPAPLVGICAARLVPGLVKPHPRGKDAGTGFAHLSGK